MIYRSLLASEGGGIINRRQQSEREDGANIAIGLGGTGASAVKVLKRKVYRELKPDDHDSLLPDDHDSPIPSYRNVKFLVIDSDASEMNNDSTVPSSLNKNTEYFNISAKGNKAFVGPKLALEDRGELDWLNCGNITIPNTANGAGGIRQVGRYLLFERSAALREKLQSMITGTLDGENGDLTIHLFSGLSGGTGSGAFLDVCYIIRDVLHSMGLSDSARVLGYFFLPDVNLSVPGRNVKPWISSYLRVNGYCALQELDYMMDLNNNGDIFRQNYGTFEVVSSEKPVDLCYLISAADADGHIVSNGYDYAMNVATDYVLSFMSKEIFPRVMFGSPFVRELWQNDLTSFTEIAGNVVGKKHGACIDYNILGSFSAEMPLSDFTTYLGARLFEKFKGIYDRTPLEKDLNEFVSRAQLSFENIIGQLSHGIGWEIGFPKLNWKAIAADNSPVMARADNWLANARGKLEESFRVLSEPLNGYRIPKNSTSLMDRTYKTLYDAYAIHVDKGPFFAMRLLGGMANKNLLHVIDGYIQENKQLLETEHRQDELRARELEEAHARLQTANFMNGGGRLIDYLNNLKFLYLHHGRIAQYEMMNDLLALYRKQVIELNNNFFKVLTTVLESLHETFRMNETFLTCSPMKVDSCTWHILTVNDVKDTLDDEVKKLDTKQVFHALVGRMFAEYPEWMSRDENKIARLVSDFILQEFDSVTKWTISDYLKVKLGAIPPGALIHVIRTQIMEAVLENRSEPLFWKSPLIRMGEIAGSCTLSIPFNSAEIVKAANDFAAGKNEFSIRRTCLMDRLSMMRFYAGMPLYAYQGLQEMEKAYEANHSAGRHLYERGEKDWNKILPSPIPDSLMTAGHEIRRIVDKNNKLKEELQRAKDLGIVVKDNSGYAIRESADRDLDKYVEGFGPYEVNWTINENLLAKIISELKSLKAKLYTENYKEVRINVEGANPADLDVVLSDNYLRYPMLNQKVKTELAKLDALDTKIAELQKVFDGNQFMTGSRA